MGSETLHSSKNLEYAVLPSGDVARYSMDDNDDFFDSIEVLEGGNWIFPGDRTATFLGDLLNGRILSSDEIAALPDEIPSPSREVFPSD